MKIRRYKRGDCAMDFIESGQWVLYADHAAVLDYKLAEAGKELTAVLERLYRAEKERDTLRDEVLAWREVDRLQAEENDTGDEAVGMAETRHTLHRAMAATDAAGILCDHVTLKPGHDHDDPDPYMPVRDSAKGAGT